jgi:hypothetical protein
MELGFVFKRVVASWSVLESFLDSVLFQIHLPMYFVLFRILLIVEGDQPLMDLNRPGAFSEFNRFTISVLDRSSANYLNVLRMIAALLGSISIL